jgi:hypothetical protein
VGGCEVAASELPGCEPFAALLINARSLYRPAADGQHFLVLTTPGRETVPPVTVVLNWAAVLK